MSEVQGFPPSASDYVLSEDMFIPDIQKATDPKDRAGRQRAVRKVVQAFNRAKCSLSLWSLSMLWNYLRTTDWVCGERDVSKHPDGRLLLEQDASSRWPMAWYGRLFVIQATCHRTDQLQSIHREHARHWGCVYHEDRPFYPDLYPDTDGNSRCPGFSEGSVAPSMGTQDSVYHSKEINRGRSPFRPKTESPCPTLADYDIIDPLHLEEAMPAPAVNQPTRPTRTNSEISRPAQADLTMPPLINQPTEPAHTSPGATPRPSHAGPALPSSLLNQPADPVHTGDGAIDHDPVDRLLTIFPDLSMPTSRRANQPTRSARTGPEVSRPAQADPTMPPPRSQTADPARTSSKAIPHLGYAGISLPSPTLRSRLMHFLATGEAIDLDDELLTTFPGLFTPASRRANQPTRSARTGPEVSRPAQADPTMPPRSQTADPARISSEVTPRPGHVGPALPPTLLNRPAGFPRTEEAMDLADEFRTVFPSMSLPAPRLVDQPIHVRGPPSLVTNPPSLRACSPRFGDLPRIPGRDPKPAGSVLDVQSCIIQATQAAQQAIDLSQRALHHVRRLEAFSSNMSNYIQQSKHHAQQSGNYMDASTFAIGGIEQEIRGSKANTEAAMTTANRALGLAERLRQYLVTET